MRNVDYLPLVWIYSQGGESFVPMGDLQSFDELQAPDSKALMPFLKVPGGASNLLGPHENVPNPSLKPTHL